MTLVLSIAILSALLLALSGAPGPAAGQSGLLAAGGTWTNPPDGPPTLGTVVVFRWRVEALTTEGFQFTLRGPAGWNNDAPRAWQVRRAGIGWLWDWAAFPSIPAVEGAYTLVAAIGGNEVTTTFHIDPSSRLQRPIVRVSATRERTGVSWTFVGGAHSYRVTLLDARRRVIDATTTRSTSHTFNVELPPVCIGSVSPRFLPISRSRSPRCRSSTTAAKAARHSRSPEAHRPPCRRLRSGI